MFGQLPCESPSWSAPKLWPISCAATSESSQTLRDSVRPDGVLAYRTASRDTRCRSCVPSRSRSVNRCVRPCELSSGRASAQVGELAQQGVRRRRCRQLIAGGIGHRQRADVDLDRQLRAEDAVDVVQAGQDRIARVLLAAVARAEARVAERRDLEPARRAGSPASPPSHSSARSRAPRTHRSPWWASSRWRTRPRPDPSCTSARRKTIVCDASAGSGCVQRVAHFGGRLDRVELRAVPHHAVQRVALGREPHPRSGDAVDRAAIQLELRLLRACSP